MKQIERLKRLRAQVQAALDELDFEDATAAVEYAEEHLAAAIETLSTSDTEEDGNG